MDLNKNKMRCLICAAGVSVPKNSVVSKDVAEILTELFWNFCNTMKWRSGSQGFDFNHDPFPFCKICRIVLVDMRNFSLENACGRLENLKASVAGRIILSDFNDEESGMSETSDMQENETGRLKYLWNFFRKQTLNEYSPQVILRVIPELNRWDREKVAVGWAPTNSRRMTASLIDDMKFGTIVLSDVISGVTRQQGQGTKKGGNNAPKTNASTTGLKKRVSCPECGTKCVTKHGLEIHQTLICGKNNARDSIIKVDQDRYLFDGLPLQRINGGRFICKSCGSDFSNMLYTQYHIRKAHSGPQNNREEPPTGVTSSLKVNNGKNGDTMGSLGGTARRRARVKTKKGFLNKKLIQENVLKLYASMLQQGKS